MQHGVVDDVREVVVDQFIHDLAPAAVAANHAGIFQYPQMLADQRLREAQLADEFVHALALLLQLYFWLAAVLRLWS